MENQSYSAASKGSGKGHLGTPLCRPGSPSFYPFSPLQPVHAWFPDVLYQFSEGSDVFIPQMNVERGIGWGLEKFSHDEAVGLLSDRVGSR